MSTERTSTESDADDVAVNPGDLEVKGRHPRVPPNTPAPFLVTATQVYRYPDGAVTIRLEDDQTHDYWTELRLAPDLVRRLAGGG